MRAKTKTFLGWITIILLSLIPVYLWFKFGAGIEDFKTFGDSVHSIGELFGLIGITMFAITFILSTRIKFIEDVFGGLDKVYIVHGILAGTALILILLHPIFLVLKFIPSDIMLAASYLLPSSYWSVNLGMIALVGMIILIHITLFTKVKYHKWKFTHEFLGLVFFLVVLHAFLVRRSVSVDNIFSGYYTYISIVSFIGLGSFFYSLVLKNRKSKNAVYKIKNINKTKNSLIFELSPEHKPIGYKSGQFVFVRFYNENLSKETHPFSIASKSGNETIRIIVKKLGDFTKRLEHIKIGDKVSLEGPYGKFHFRNYHGKDQVWIAAGVGITPFFGMVEDLIEQKKDKIGGQIDLYYSVSREEDFMGYNFLEDSGNKIKGFRFIPWNSSKKGHIGGEEIKKISGIEGKEFLICGPEKFKESVIHKLIKLGANKSDIHEEMFDFR